MSNIDNLSEIADVVSDWRNGEWGSDYEAMREISFILNRADATEFNPGDRIRYASLNLGHAVPDGSPGTVKRIFVDGDRAVLFDHERELRRVGVRHLASLNAKARGSL